MKDLSNKHLFNRMREYVVFKYLILMLKNTILVSLLVDNICTVKR